MNQERLLRRGVAVVLFVNAFLVFVLQPHISRQLLPLLDGRAEVWIVCTLFFQVALVAGYALAFAARRRPLRVSLSRHVALLLVAWLLWPMTTGDGPPPEAAPPLWTLRLLVGQLGLLVTALTATSPLLQYAYAHASPTLDPYPLFTASNAGSIAGLIAGPLIVDPLLTLPQQTRAWSASAIVLLALLAVVGHRLSAASGNAAVPPLAPGVPLGVYRASFIRVFSPGWHPWRRTWPILALLSLLMLLNFANEPNQLWWIAVHLIILWSASLMCHGELVQTRPVPARLPEFYVWMAAGGAAGGAVADAAEDRLHDRAAIHLEGGSGSGRDRSAGHHLSGLDIRLAWRHPRRDARCRHDGGDDAASPETIHRPHYDCAAGNHHRSSNASARCGAARPHVLRHLRGARFSGVSHASARPWHDAARHAVPAARTSRRSPQLLRPHVAAGRRVPVTGAA